MLHKTVWAIALVAAIGAVAVQLSGQPVQGAESGVPAIVVGDTYAFVGLEGGLVSGPVLSVGPYPWVEVKVDNVDANVYTINLEHVERFKHMTR